jgi:DNA-binding NarL/FixJ family response regulator
MELIREVTFGNPGELILLFFIHGRVLYSAHVPGGTKTKIGAVMATPSRSAIAVLAASRYRAEALALSISAHSEHDACPLTQAESSVLASCSKILLELDVNMESVLKLVRDTTAQFPDATVLVLGFVESEEGVVKLAEAGASGYIPADASFQDMLSIIQSARRGEFACTPHVTYALFSRLAELAQNQEVDGLLDSGITTREQQVLELLTQDLSNKEIANRLCVSENTVKNHVHNLLGKLGVSDRSVAVRFRQQKALPPARTVA